MEIQNLSEKIDSQVDFSAFSAVAKNIIKSAFRSAICIDNEYASAYSLDDNLDRDEPRILYNSFREQASCDLNIFEFRTIEDSWKNHMIENKDLMILDWELDPGDRFDSTIKILKEVVVTKKIPFVVIYTNTEVLDSIVATIISKFNPISNEDYSSFTKQFNSDFTIISDDDSINFDDLSEDPSVFFEYFHHFSKQDESERRILSWISKCFSIKEAVSKGPGLKTKIVKIINRFFKESEGRELEYLSFLILRDNNPIVNCSLKRIKINKYSYILNEFTTVIIFHKKTKSGGITPEMLFAEFAETITSDPHSFLSLLALEFRDKLKENFYSIGAKFSSISEKAFLYHMGNYKEGEHFKKGAIYDFILRSWINELYQQKIGEKSEVLNFLPNRYKQKENELQLNNHIVTELLRYSAYISTTDLSYKKDKDVWFGDIFKGDKNEYYLCITPHCDCLRPGKIKNNYYFVKGVFKDDKIKALENAEKDFLSFVLDGSPTCIEWINKPFTAFIPKPTIDEVTVTYGTSTKNLVYITSLKENYAQRISNEAFSYGYRVGIDLPHILAVEDSICTV